MWTGAIRFGLVNVPVKLFSATAQKELSFHMLHDKDGGRIRQKRVCAVDGEEVPYDHVVKGYEIHKGQYVEISPEELARYHPKATQAIDIEDFVDLTEIDPIYYDRTYYLAPDRGAGKAYVLLLEAMKEMGKVGIARVVMRTKQYLCAVRPMGGALALSTLLYADEVRSLDEVEALPDEAELAPKPRELQMAKSLIDSLAAPFEPDKYKDEYREQVLKLIEQKAEGEELVGEPAEEAPKGKVVDLMAALEASLQEAKGGERRFRAQAAKASREPPARKKKAATPKKKTASK
jgi:DNA end-binding protein Ku